MDLSARNALTQAIHDLIRARQSVRKLLDEDIIPTPAEWETWNTLTLDLQVALATKGSHDEKAKIRDT